MVEPRAACPGLISADLMADAKLGKALTLKLKTGALEPDHLSIFTLKRWRFSYPEELVVAS